MNVAEQVLSVVSSSTRTFSENEDSEQCEINALKTISWSPSCTAIRRLSDDYKQYDGCQPRISTHEECECNIDPFMSWIDVMSTTRKIEPPKETLPSEHEDEPGTEVLREHAESPDGKRDSRSLLGLWLDLVGEDLMPCPDSPEDEVHSCAPPRSLLRRPPT